MDTPELKKLKEKYKQLKTKKSKIFHKHFKLLTSIKMSQKNQDMLFHYFEQYSYIEYCKGYNEAQRHQIEDHIKNKKKITSSKKP